MGKRHAPEKGRSDWTIRRFAEIPDSLSWHIRALYTFSLLGVDAKRELF